MNQRGSLTLFAEIFEQPAFQTSEKRKGRSYTLNQKRNACLIDRYYWHGRLEIDNKRISYQSLLQTISEEFFLSPITIPEIISDNLDCLIELKKNWGDQDTASLQRHFQKKWPHLVWK